MLDEMVALESNNTWIVVSPPPEKSAIGCRCVLLLRLVLMGEWTT